MQTLMVLVVVLFTITGYYLYQGGIFTTAVTCHSNRTCWRGGGAYIHVNTVVETNYDKINRFDRDLIVIHVSK